MQVFNTFELDDYPLDAHYTIETLERYHEANPSFKASLFAVPAAMTDLHYELVASKPWIRLYPHGFHHNRRECNSISNHKLNILDKVSDDPRWGSVFKGPHYGVSTDLMLALRERGMSIAIKTIRGVEEIPEMLSWDRPGRVLIADDCYRHVLKHTRYIDGMVFKRRAGPGLFSCLKERFNRPYIAWLKKQKAPFRFVDECLEPAVKRINLGCGPLALPGWLNLDHRPDLMKNVEKWVFPSPIPCISNRANIVFTSHFLNYIEDYVELFLEIWRVLKPGGIYRLEEDATESGYCWRRKGKRHPTGRIKSEPTLKKVASALEKVGFKISVKTPFETDSGCREVLALHTRNKRYRNNQKFILEAVKEIDIRNFSRTYLDDKRAPRRGDYPYTLPEEKKDERQS